LAHDIGTLVIGYAETFQSSPQMGKRNNQNFVNLPLGNLKEKLEYLCEMYGMNFVKQEESYTSKASFFDNDLIPVYNADNPIDFEFSGKRVKRGLFRHSRGTVNADVNGALNILKKSNVVSLTGLCARGEVDTPVRIRIA
jgi:IS605 OrfB family transposase